MDVDKLNDHGYIEANNVVELYALDRLPVDVREGFEAHLVDCAECLDSLEAAEGLHGGLRAVAVDEATRARVVAAAGLVAWLHRRRRLFVGLALIAIAALPAAWLFFESRRLSDELARQREAMADWQQKYESVQQVPQPPPSENGNRVAELEEERQRLEAELARERERRAETDGRSGRRERPRQPAPAVIEFDTVRSEMPGRPVSIPLEQTAGRVVLSIDAAILPEYPSYRITAASNQEQTRWSQSGLEPDRQQRLRLEFPTGFLKPGRYHVSLVGETADGGQAFIATYAFVVVE